MQSQGNNRGAWNPPRDPLNVGPFYVEDAEVTDAARGILCLGKYSLATFFLLLFCVPFFLLC